MRTKTNNGQHLKSLQQKDSPVFSSIDNNVANRMYKSIQSDKEKQSALLNKENYNSHSFISCSYDNNLQQQVYQPPRQFYKHISQTFTTDINHDRVLPTTERPTMGGKSISSIPITPTNNNRMSTAQLKSLSRRINPNEPLSSPHASPSKPPLPIINTITTNTKKRQRPMNTLGEQLNTKTQKTSEQFTCKPCNKKYKTRNGYSYHMERCKFLSKNDIVIHCICKEPTLNAGTMIECTQCNSWLHIQCIGTVNDENSFCCPRCSSNNNEEEEEEEHVLQNGRTIKLSELCQAKEHGKNLLQSFIETENEVEVEVDRNEFNFISLFSDDTVSNQSPILHSNNNNDEEEEEDFTSSFTNDWDNDVPSLLFSDNNYDDLPSSDLSITQSDWLHFANFEVDFHLGEL